MQTADLAAQLERVLGPADLRLSGAALYRMLDARLEGKATLGRSLFKRVGSDGRTLLVRLRPIGSDRYTGDPYLLTASETGVQALALPTGAVSGAAFGPWRRRDDRIVGVLYPVEGNRSSGCVVALRREGGRWRIAAQRNTNDESAGIEFLGKGLDRLRSSTRSDRLRTLNQPLAGPLPLLDSTWTVLTHRVVATPPHLRRTPLDALDRFCEAFRHHREQVARSLCAPSLYDRVCRLVAKSGTLSVSCPYSDEIDDGRFLGLRDTGGAPRLYFEMASWRGDWRIVGLRRLEECPRPKIPAIDQG